jgi:hypothetical protein
MGGAILFVLSTKDLKAGESAGVYDEEVTGDSLGTTAQQLIWLIQSSGEIRNLLCLDASGNMKW